MCDFRGKTHPLAYGPMVRAFLLLLTIFVSGRTIWAQATTSVRGAVTDPSGRAVAGATITITNPESKTERTATTGEQGEYQFMLLPPGTYTLTVTATGFAHYEQTGLQLLVNTPATANIELKLGQSTQSVTVTSEAPALNMVDASIGNTFGETQMEQIPLEGRNVPDLLNLQAGVTYTGNRTDVDKQQDTRSGSVNGARSDQSNVTLDGVDVNDQGAGSAFTSVLPVTLDSVQEFRVTTTNYNADQGQGSGAQVALVTKSGTNKFHGSLYEYMRNTLTSANDYLVQQSELASGQPNKPLKLIRNIFGASVGGPVKKDRLFFFANYEGTRQREEQSVLRTIPTPSLCLGNVSYDNLVGGGVTTLTPTDIKNLDPAGLGINKAILDLTNPNQPAGYFGTTFCNGKYPTNDTSVADGKNYAGFRFRAPVSLDNNAIIVRLDYNLTSNSKHTLFWRGALQNLSNPQAPFLPGTPPEQTIVDHSKGFVVGYTSVLSNTLANTFRWGFTRQSQGFFGNADSTKPWNTFLGLDTSISQTLNALPNNYSHNFQMPVHNFIDDFSWTKGKHTLQFGGNVGIARDPRVSYLHSFSTAVGTTSWMAPTGFANTTSTLDPGAKGYPEPLNSVAYDYPMLSLLGMVSQMIGNFNYDRNGNILPDGKAVTRDYGLNWYELYAQDSWRVKPNLTVTYGVRWELLPPPWEVNGLQATPTVNLGQAYDQNVANMKKGIGYEAMPPVSFVLGGPVNHGRGFYDFEKTDFAPRVSVAYTPRFQNDFLKKLFGTGDKTVIRGGFGKVYDRAGMQLINTFDQNAPAGLSATVQNPCCLPVTDGAENVPRITNINQIPQLGLNRLQFAPLGANAPFPQTPSVTANAITWGVDQSLKTPYAYTVDFSIGRELPKRFSLQLSYIGRIGRNLLTQRDLMQPLDLVDPKTGIDYFAAAARISQLARENQANANAGKPLIPINDSTVGPTNAFWHDMLPSLALPLPGGPSNNYQPFGNPSFLTSDLMQAIYTLYTTTDTYPGNEVVGLGNIDLYYYLSDTQGNYYDFGNSAPSTNPAIGDMLNSQLTSMYAWSSVGKSNYNALQASLRKQFSSGVQLDFNYTYSKSIDITSTAVRVGYNQGINGSQLVNAFSPNQNRAVSDFDTTHQINADWIAELPFGKGRTFARNAGGALDAFIGGWQISGLARWTSGFPFSIGNGQAWASDWNYSGLATMISRPVTGVFHQPDGSVSVFADPAAAKNNSFQLTYPGQSGTRNALRGPGYAGWDMSLSKRWKLPFEGHSLQFRGEVFNVPNLKRFNVQSVANPYTLQQLPSKFGDYTSLLTQPRVMQFALRYEF